MNFVTSKTFFLLVKPDGQNPPHSWSIPVIAVEFAVKYCLVLKGMQTRLKSQYNAELTLSP